MGASLIAGTSTIHFAQENYMVQDVMGFLKACGVRIERENISTIRVTGLAEINKNIEYWNSEDPIESMAFITAAIMTKSTLTVTHCPVDFIRLELYKLELMGQKYTMSDEYLSENGFTKLVDVTMVPSKLVAPKDKLHPLPYPGINVDNLPFFVPICTQAEGTTLINDWMWENRALYFTELNRLGANVSLADPHRVFVQGPTPLKAAQIFCPPALRPSMIIFLAMLGAPGISTLRNVYSINRGYENIAERLNAIGADIERITDIG
jgi:UDP-N-acetylglucosamine 1-carboxyvinyltransferase